MCAEGWIDNTPKWVLVRDVQEMTRLYKQGTRIQIALYALVLFSYFSQIFDGEGPKKEENTCKGHPRHNDSHTSQDGPSSGVTA